MAGRRDSLINPITSRLISSPGDAASGHGTLDFVPEGYASARSFVTSALKATESEHGTAFSEFVRRLAAMRVYDEAELRGSIARHVEAFLEREDGAKGGMLGRIAEAFAIVSVAGGLAKHLKIVPQEWEPEAIALESYQRYRASIQAAEGRPVLELLRSYAARPDIVDLDQGVPTLTDEEMLAVPGFRRTVSGRTELLLHPDVITYLFPDWERRKGSMELQAFLVRDGQHLTCQRVVRRGSGRQADKDHMHAFANF